MIDSHCHLDFDHFEGEREKVIDMSKRRVKAIINSSADIESAEMVLNLHQKYPKFIFPTLGLHPKNAISSSGKDIENLKETIRANKDTIVGIGEVGLDNYHVKKSKEQEKAKKIFLEFIELSNTLNLPLVVHSRDSFEDTIDLLNNREGKTVIHCFSGNKSELERCLDRDYYLSFGGMVFRAADRYKKILKNTPLENILLETDAPFLAKKKSERSEPWFIRQVAQKIAEIKNLEFDEIWEKTGENAKEVFSLPVQL